MAPNKKINVKERYTDGEIDLSMSDLDDVPVKEIAALKKTTSLDLSNNRLSILPANFTTLTNLTKLDLSKNELKELPEDFGHLSRLKYLDLYKNLLEHLPLSFSKLKELRFLDVKDNPLVPTVAKVAGPCIDTKGCQKCAKDIVVFFTKLQAQVDSEVEMRNKSRRKQLELNQQKRMEEHEKKKIEQSLRRNIEINASSQNNSSGNKKSKKEKKNKRNKYYKDDSSEYTLFNVFVTILFISFLITMVLFLLTSVKFKYTHSVELLVKDSYHSFVLKLPPNMQPYAHKTGELIQGIHESVGSTTNLIIQSLNLEERFEALGNISGRAYAYVAKKMVDLIADEVIINNDNDVV